MSSVQPVSVTDLNGVAINPTDIITDELIGYVSYVQNLCTDLGSKNDSKEGYQSFIDFQKEIQAAKISTFEPEDIQSNDNFEKLDLTGENADIVAFQTSYYMSVLNTMLMANSNKAFTPFDGNGREPYLFNGKGLTPFDVTNSIPTEEDSLVLC